MHCSPHGYKSVRLSKWIQETAAIFPFPAVAIDRVSSYERTSIQLLRYLRSPSHTYDVSRSPPPWTGVASLGADSLVSFPSLSSLSPLGLSGVFDAFPSRSSHYLRSDAPAFFPCFPLFCMVLRRFFGTFFTFVPSESRRFVPFTPSSSCDPPRPPLFSRLRGAQTIAV